ncbi:MAG: RNA polymerase, sigma-24 subunit, ECF subfamily [Candidatus Pacebacteria bacterium GW2011_GWF2_38_9]|nr:MAG: RNA polymerase sigma factor SigW, RNA polymerase sigma-70 factor, ECF subfamily [candidate division TM6 bacterium GW2011_GWF2_28_16]KKQ08464.1 MAG: RNA polymerase, sigma-24 subunit, ECF subfamily [Candidatus Pacebacteria bacterium GW2011_GWF1_36_5]KKQ88728.1 MAG: RNA polymerase, sigma-24 subunit, ECF subfamily [Candidatus Pacebacteria bacterium GW2011_GWF2_38_9]
MPELSNLSDEAIVKIVRTKDKNLYAEIIRRYEKKLLRYALYLINDESLAADAVQEGFIKAYVNLHSFNAKMKFSSWLYRIIHNQAINLIHKNKPHFSFEENLELDSGIDLEDDLIKKELKAHLHNCINQMSILYKEPLTLYFLEEKTYEEISDILRLPIGTVGTRINRAKHLVKKLCQKKQ